MSITIARVYPGLIGLNPIFARVTLVARVNGNLILRALHSFHTESSGREAAKPRSGGAGKDDDSHSGLESSDDDNDGQWQQEQQRKKKKQQLRPSSKKCAQSE